MVSPHQILLGMFDAAVNAVAARENLPEYLPPPPKGRTVMIAVGKAAASMAHVALDARPDIEQGIVLIPYGHRGVGLDFPPTVELIEASHPVPDEMGLKAARKALDLVQALGKNDQLLALISGGGSSLLTMPRPGITLKQKQAITKSLLRSGASITEINTIRSCLSAIKGGQLARAALPAQVVTLVISDVPGDDPAYVASGPTVISPVPRPDVAAMIRKYGIAWPKGEYLAPDFCTKTINQQTTVIANGDKALQAAQSYARDNGIIDITNLGASIEGEASEVARTHAQIAKRQAKQYPMSLILSGGETSVTLGSAESGRGGRNAEYLLALALSLNGAEGIYAIACDTDGIDGTEDNAGAILMPDTLCRARQLDMCPQDYLDRHDAYSFFRKLGDLVVTGPTLTNVNDFRAILMI